MCAQHEAFPSGQSSRTSKEGSFSERLGGMPQSICVVPWVVGLHSVMGSSNANLPPPLTPTPAQPAEPHDQGGS